MCSRSAVKIGRPLISRRITDSTVSRIGRPKETIGMATATIVGAFCAPERARALSKKPMNRLPESPRKMVAGLKLKRRKPRIAPAKTSVISSTRLGPLSSATTKTTIVENRAEPAAKPSKPSIKLKALVMARTQTTVNNRPTYHGRARSPKRTGMFTIRRPPA